MSEAMTVAAAPDADGETWALRPWVLAGLMGAAGLLIHFVTQDRLQLPGPSAAAAFLLFGSVAAALTLDMDRWREPAVFSVGAGLVMAGLAWRAVAGGDRFADPGFGFAAGVLATALSLPLFQAGFHRRRFAVPYAELHDMVWTDGISAGGSLACTALSWVVLSIIAKLFALLNIHLIEYLMRDAAFDWTFSGVVFGAALGTIRNELRLLGTLRTIVMMVLSLLAVPVAAALAAFLAAMVVSGRQVLWQATSSSTPTLLACAAGAFGLANTVLRYSDAEMPGNRAMRLAALVLALTILPLTAFAAVSMGTRIVQHGLSPERIWAMVAIAVACAYAVAYAVAVLGGLKGRWRQRVRSTNLALAVGVCGVALFLALPIFDFGAISASSQVGRLQSGKVAPDKFDFAALRWDMGEGGRRALARLATSGNARIAELAGTAQRQTSRPYCCSGGGNKARGDFKLRVQPDDPNLRSLVLDHLVPEPWLCQETCVALDLGPGSGERRKIALVSGDAVLSLELPSPPRGRATVYDIDNPLSPMLKPNSTVSIGSVTKHYVLVDGKPVGQPID